MAKAPKKHVKTLLESMAHGAVRCMYCDDSRGTDIDHFQPLAVAPLRAFAWDNHLLACSFCNSNAKRDEYPVDADGVCLLVDPTAEDPGDHLFLMLRSGEYGHHTDKGKHTIRVFGLNRPDLVMGRKDAFFLTCSVLRDWHGLRREGAPEADRVAQALLDSPFVDVVYAIAQRPWSHRHRGRRAHGSRCRTLAQRVREIGKRVVGGSADQRGACQGTCSRPAHVPPRRGGGEAAAVRRSRKGRRGHALCRSGPLWCRRERLTRAGSSTHQQTPLPLQVLLRPERLPPGSQRRHKAVLVHARRDP